MKKFLPIFIGLVLIFSLAFLFSGCELLKKAAENLQQDAELASKALGTSSYNHIGYTSTGLKVVAYNQSGDITGSIYYNDQYNYQTFSLEFTNEQVPITDESGNLE